WSTVRLHRVSVPQLLPCYPPGASGHPHRSRGCADSSLQRLAERWPVHCLPPTSCSHAIPNSSLLRPSWRCGKRHNDASVLVQCPARNRPANHPPPPGPVERPQPVLELSSVATH